MCAANWSLVVPAAQLPSGSILLGAIGDRETFPHHSARISGIRELWNFKGSERAVKGELQGSGLWFTRSYKLQRTHNPSIPTEWSSGVVVSALPEKTLGDRWGSGDPGRGFLSPLTSLLTLRPESFPYLGTINFNPLPHAAPAPGVNLRAGLQPADHAVVGASISVEGGHMAGLARCLRVQQRLPFLRAWPASNMARAGSWLGEPGGVQPSAPTQPGP